MRDSDFSRILDVAIENTNSDGGIIYALEEMAGGTRVLVPRHRRYDSSGDQTPPPTLPLDSGSLPGFAALNRRVLSIPNVYRIPEDRPYRFDRTTDRKNEYRTISALVTPFVNVGGDVSGVLQLVNYKIIKHPLRSPRDFALYVRPYTRVHSRIAQVVVRMGSLMIDGTVRRRQLHQGFDSLLRAVGTTTEARDETTSGHTASVVTLVTMMATEIHRTHRGPFSTESFPQGRIEALRAAAMIHDAGNLLVDARILRKDTRLLPDEHLLLETRLDYAIQNWELRMVRQQRNAAIRIEQRQRKRELIREIMDEQNLTITALQKARKTILHAIAGGGTADTLAAHEAISVFNDLGTTDPDGNPWQPVPSWVTESLTSDIGNLTCRERAVIEDHVKNTVAFATKITWPEEMHQVVRICREHHERLDGSGYPEGISGRDNLLLESRILMVADIFEAITSPQRRYRKKRTVDQAITHLREEAAQGKLDPDIVDVLARVVKTKDQQPSPRVRRRYRDPSSAR